MFVPKHCNQQINVNVVFFFLNNHVMISKNSNKYIGTSSTDLDFSVILSFRFHYYSLTEMEISITQNQAVSEKQTEMQMCIFSIKLNNYVMNVPGMRLPPGVIWHIRLRRWSGLSTNQKVVGLIPYSSSLSIQVS